MTISRQGTRGGDNKQGPKSSTNNSAVAVVPSASDTLVTDLSATGTPRRPQTAPSIPAAQDHVSPVRVKDVDARLGALEVVKGASSPQDDIAVVVRAGTTTADVRSMANVSHRPVSAKDREEDGRPLELIAPMAVLPVSHAPFTRAVTSSGSTPRK